MSGPSTDGKITGTQWKGLVAAWLGWAFDGLDGYLYILVALPFVRSLMTRQVPGADGELLAVQPDPADVAFKAALIQAFFLIGWAVGGAVFGRIGDRIGRSRTLTLTILTYALFTGLAFFATQWWHLLIFRFVAALGIGGEWAAGSALVSEMLHKRHRAWASATLQSGYMVGMMAAALTTSWLSHLPPRYVFLVGVAPALLTLWIRWAVPEPAEWHAAAKAQDLPPVTALFSPRLRGTTVKLLLLTSIALTTVWAFLYFLPQAIRGIPDVRALEKTEVAALIMRVTITFTLINIAGNYFATYLARAVGYRRAFQLLMAASLLSFAIGFATPPTLDTIYLRAGFAAFFGLGLFGLFPLYIPPQFPTLVRTLGAGITYNTGRLVAGIGTFSAGAISAQAGGPHRAIFWIGLLFAAGVAVSFVIPDATDESGSA